MKSKLLALAVLAGGAVFGQVRFSVGIGTPYAVVSAASGVRGGAALSGSGLHVDGRLLGLRGSAKVVADAGYWAPPVYARGYYYGGGPRYYYAP